MNVTDSTDDLEQQLLQLIDKSAADLPGSRRRPRQDIHMDTSIMSDLGFDSITIVELACAVEDALQIGDLPLHAWFDQESEQTTKRFTVASFLEMVRQTRDRDGSDATAVLRAVTARVEHEADARS
jgi:acyl carrier protein